VPRDLVPELHDIGKLLDNDALNRTLGSSGVRFTGHCFRGVDLARLGISEPQNLTWVGVKEHLNSTWDKLPGTLGLPEQDAQARWQVFLLKLADHLAACTGRAVYQDKEEARVEKTPYTYRLWNPEYHKGFPGGGLIATLDGLTELVDLARAEPQAHEFLKKYRDRLASVPEDKGAPRNVTTLRTHVELVGKIFRVLNACLQCGESDGRLVGQYQAVQATSVAKAEGPRPMEGPGGGKWVFRFVKANFLFPHSISRLQDLNILAERARLLCDLLQKFPNNVLLHAPDFAFLFLPQTVDPAKMFEPFTSRGFRVEATEIAADLGLLNSDLDSKQRFQEFKKYYREEPEAERHRTEKTSEELQAEVEDLKSRRAALDARLEQPSADRPALGEKRREVSQALHAREDELRSVEDNLDRLAQMPNRFRVVQTGWHAPKHEGRFSRLCPVCQLNPCGPQPWVKGKFVDEICTACKQIREMGDPATEYARWDELDVRVGWVKLSLHSAQRAQAVESLFRDCVLTHAFFAQINDKQRDIFLRNFRPLAVEIDFTHDYLKMLGDFRGKLCADGEELPPTVLQPIPQYPELFIAQVNDSGTLFALLDNFLTSLGEHFPVFCSPEAVAPCPVHFSISVSDTKFPFNAHWRTISASTRPINICVPSRGIHLELEVKNFLRLKQALYEGVPAATSQFLYQLSGLASAGTPLGAEVSLIERRERFPGIFDLYRSGVATIGEILDFYRLTVD